MRQTCIGAIGSNIPVRPTHVRAHVGAVALGFALISIQARTAFAANDLSLNTHFARHEARYQPGPSSLRVPHAAPDSALPLAAAPALYSESFWTAFADQDLFTLRQAARSEAEARFAEAMTLLAGGNHESAESAFVAVSQQSKDLNAAVAAQVMLASTLRYQGKWKELRDLPLNSKLSADDRKITSDLESWGQAFAGAGKEVVRFPSRPSVMPLKVTPVGTPVIQVRVNGKEYDFWLDTGSSMTVISSRVASDAGISPLSSDVLAVRTFAGSAPVRAATIDRLELGPIVVMNSPAVIIDASLMYLRASADGVPAGGLQVDGIIGWDAIRQLDVTMNYAGGWIVLKEPMPRSMTAAQQNLTWLGRPFVEVCSKSGGNLHFTLDTGAQTTFLNATVLERVGVGTKRSDNRVFGIAKTDRQTSRVVPVLAVDVGGLSVRLQDVIVYGPVSSPLINSDGILGSDMARYGTIHIDATNGVFTLGGSPDSEDATE